MSIRLSRAAEYGIAAALSLLVTGFVLLATDAYPDEQVSLAKPIAIYSLSLSADLGSTAWAESRGAVEVNQLYADKGTRYAVHAATLAGLVAADMWAQKKGKRGWARALRVAVVVVRGYAVQRNVRNAR